MTSPKPPKPLATRSWQDFLSEGGYPPLVFNAEGKAVNTAYNPLLHGDPEALATRLLALLPSVPDPVVEDALAGAAAFAVRDADLEQLLKRWLFEVFEQLEPLGFYQGAVIEVVRFETATAWAVSVHGRLEDASRSEPFDVLLTLAIEWTSATYGQFSLGLVAGYALEGAVMAVCSPKLLTGASIFNRVEARKCLEEQGELVLQTQFRDSVRQVLASRVPQGLTPLLGAVCGELEAVLSA